MSLKAYREKRNFRRTPEPAGGAGERKGQPIFVVQEHHASRLHYDFRLEANGALKSWAVPKEPPNDPSQKRLAVHVEDHPLEYATFQGTIPEGQYGAGRVKIWDHGTFDNLMAKKTEPLSVTESIEAGHVEVALHGKKLKGNFALVRMKGQRQSGKDNWLLIKMKDRPATAKRTRARKPKAARRKKADPPNGARSSAPASPKTALARPRNLKSARPPAQFTDFTHTDKLMYPGDGITKADVLEFYERISQFLLPYLHDRPATLERLPDGLGGRGAPHFWQKDTPSYYPDWIPRVELPSAFGKRVHYVLVNDTPTLLYLVNQGTLTFHVWLSRIGNIDRPDFVLFDLDPGRASFADAVAVARHLHLTLKADGHNSCVKTSGKTGLHVLVPWKYEGGYDDARAWALEFAQQVADELPDQATTEIRKAKRGLRVYIDVMQNARGHHAVPPYVIRAVPGAPVSTPLSWRELKPQLDPAQFNVKTIFRRLSRRHRDTMRQGLGLEA